MVICEMRDDAAVMPSETQNRRQGNDDVPTKTTIYVCMDEPKTKRPPRSAHVGTLKTASYEEPAK